MEPELAVDSASGSRPGGGKAIILHVVPQGMRPSSSDGGRMGGGRRRIEYASDQSRRFVSSGICRTSIELASTAAADGTPRLEHVILGGGAGGVCKGEQGRTGGSDRRLS